MECIVVVRAGYREDDRSRRTIVPRKGGGAKGEGSVRFFSSSLDLSNR